MIVLLGYTPYDTRRIRAPACHCPRTLKLPASNGRILTNQSLQHRLRQTLQHALNFGSRRHICQIAVCRARCAALPPHWQYYTEDSIRNAPSGNGGESYAARWFHSNSSVTGKSPGSMLLGHQRDVCLPCMTLCVTTSSPPTTNNASRHCNM